MRTLAALLRETANMRAMYPTEREREAYAYLMAGTALGLAACVLAWPEWRCAPDETDQTTTEDRYDVAA